MPNQSGSPLEIKITSVFWDLSQLTSSLLLLLEKNDFFFNKLFSLHDLISSKYEFGTAIFAVSKNRFCDLKDRSSNLKELIPIIIKSLY